MRGGEVRRSALLVIVVGLLVAFPWLAGQPGSAGAIIPCPHVAGGLSVVGTMGSSPPNVLNPCPGFEWAKTFGTAAEYNAAAALDVTADGGAVIVVWTHIQGGPASATLVKLDGEGMVQWQNKYDVGTTGPGKASVTQTADGGFALAITGAQSRGEADANVFRLDAIGGILWQAAFDTPGNGDTWSIAETLDGGFVLGGMAYAYGTQPYDPWILRLDSSGGLVWLTTYGGPGEDYARAGVVPAPDGGFVAAGTTAGASSWWGWVTKFDSSGNVVWQKKYTQDVEFESIQTTTDGGYVVSGTVSKLGAKQWAVVKLTATGGISWQKTYGQLNGRTSIVQTRDGGYVSSAFLYGGIGLLRLDSSGKGLWQRYYDGPDWDSPCWRGCVQEASDGNILVAGETRSFGTGGPDSWSSYDAWVLRVFSDGTISSTCDPGFAVSYDSPTVQGTKIKAGSVTMPEVPVSWTTVDPGTVVVPGTLVAMTQCSA